MDKEPRMIIVYLIGVAGVGKTTTVQQLIKDWKFRCQIDKPFAHSHYNSTHGKSIVLGKNKLPFAGTDTLSWTAINHWETFLKTCLTHKVELIIGEGDRFSTTKCFEIAQQHGKLLTYNLEAPDPITLERRQQRATQYNKTLQNESWVAGRKTKTNNLAQKFNCRSINANLPTETIAQTIYQDINNVNQ